MQNLNTTNQSKDKITSCPGMWIGEFTCYNTNDDDSESVNIQLTALEEMWYGHEENINHPEGSEYPESINVPHLKLMRERVFDSVLERTGIDVRKFDSILHAITSPAKNPDGTLIEDVYSKRIIRNVQPQDGVFSEFALEGLENF
tara:strand:- start:1629 stop:2063 length:435 start_codon:yes stop_codon:yes gene_type:complete